MQCFLFLFAAADLCRMSPYACFHPRTAFSSHTASLQHPAFCPALRDAFRTESHRMRAPPPAGRELHCRCRYFYSNESQRQKEIILNENTQTGQHNQVTWGTAAAEMRAQKFIDRHESRKRHFGMMRLRRKCRKECEYDTAGKCMEAQTHQMEKKLQRKRKSKTSGTSYGGHAPGKGTGKNKSRKTHDRPHIGAFLACTCKNSKNRAVQKEICWAMRGE